MSNHNHRHEKRGRERMIGAWTSFITTSLLFGLLFGIILHWGWWVWIIPFFTLLSAIRSTIRYRTLESRLCPYCRARLDVDAKFCRSCGNEVLNQCPHCGAKVLHSGQFCENCGKSLAIPTSTPAKKTFQAPVSEDVVQQSQRFIFCPMCGTQIDASSKICPTCGAKL